MGTCPDTDIDKDNFGILSLCRTMDIGLLCSKYSSVFVAEKYPKVLKQVTL